jgi:hypothetical protein
LPDADETALEALPKIMAAQVNMLLVHPDLRADLPARARLWALAALPTPCFLDDPGERFDDGVERSWKDLRLERAGLHVGFARVVRAGNLADGVFIAGEGIVHSLGALGLGGVVAQGDVAEAIQPKTPGGNTQASEMGSGLYGVSSRIEVSADPHSKRRSRPWQVPKKRSSASR